MISAVRQSTVVLAEIDREDQEHDLLRPQSDSRSIRDVRRRESRSEDAPPDVVNERAERAGSPLISRLQQVGSPSKSQRHRGRPGV